MDNSDWRETRRNMGLRNFQKGIQSTKAVESDTRKTMQSVEGEVVES